MKSLPIPDDDQIRAILDGTLVELLGQYVERPPTIDFRKYITIDQAKLADYLRAHASLAKAYFQRQAAFGATHDVQKIFRRGATYVVVSMYHGKEMDPHEFPTLAEAVAKHILARYGVY